MIDSKFDEWAKKVVFNLTTTTPTTKTSAIEQTTLTTTTTSTTTTPTTAIFDVQDSDFEEFPELPDFFDATPPIQPTSFWLNTNHQIIMASTIPTMVVLVLLAVCILGFCYYKTCCRCGKKEEKVEVCNKYNFQYWNNYK